MNQMTKTDLERLTAEYEAQQAPEKPAPLTRITALRGKLVVRRDPPPETAGSFLIPEAYRDKRGGRQRGMYGTIVDVGPAYEGIPAPQGADFVVGQRIAYEETSEHGVSEYLPSLGSDLLIVRQDMVLAVVEEAS